MPSIEATVRAAEGLHARPASLFVQAAKKAKVPVTISMGDSEPVSAASMLRVLTLGAKCGDTVTLSAEGEGAEEALAELARVLAEVE